VNDNSCLLTIGDFATLAVLHEQWTRRDHDLTRQLRAKLDAAKVVFPDDLPRDVASLGSRIAYAVGEDRHISVLTGTTGLDRGWLPITLPIGLALLGQREGWAMNFDIGPARSRLLTLGRVMEQPEASWPGRFSPRNVLVETPSLRLVRSSAKGRVPQAKSAHPYDEDPGPAAALTRDPLPIVRNMEFCDDKNQLCHVCARDGCPRHEPVRRLERKNQRPLLWRLRQTRVGA
jgi:regulator of nucleoside diphosphate kinase